MVMLIGVVDLVVVVGLNVMVLMEEGEDTSMTNSVVMSTYLLNSFWPLVGARKEPPLSLQQKVS